MMDISTVTINGIVYNLKDANVPSWAKESSKPSYTVNEISGLEIATVAETKAYLGIDQEEGGLG